MNIEIINEDLVCPQCKTPIKAGEGVHFYLIGKDATILRVAAGHFVCPLEMEKLNKMKETLGGGR